ncbi:Chaperone protein DnaJ [Mucinivorans hirudinis]|uniref:Chaperone protein DnaJ n=1 Tax=Mucinivorans hirudinis TaxID=1433126 RepID=A0A060RC29_9BACT|nr:Chaperone protein DnaJ [Mucinivorans hirudinis]
MKNAILIFVFALIATAASAQGGYFDDDLYGTAKKRVTPTVKQPAQQKKYYSTVRSGEDKMGEYVDNYEDALRNRVEGFTSDRQYPREYWQMQDKFVEMLSKKYDRAFYNVIVINDKVWVEPNYVTTLFDDGDPTLALAEYVDGVKKGLNSNNVSITVNVVDPWRTSWGMSYFGLSYAWGRPWYGSAWYSPWYNPWYDPWYSSWYDPWYNPWYGSWYSWHSPWYNSWHNHWWGGGYYPGGGHHPGGSGGSWYPDKNRPSRYYGNTASGGRPSGNNRNGDYRTGSGFGGGGVAENRPNVKVYDNSNRNETPTRRPGAGSTISGSQERGTSTRRPYIETDNRTTTTRNERPTTERNNYTPPAQNRQTVTTPPAQTRSTYTPPAGNRDGGGTVTRRR